MMCGFSNFDTDEVYAIARCTALKDQLKHEGRVMRESFRSIPAPRRYPDDIQAFHQSLLFTALIGPEPSLPKLKLASHSIVVHHPDSSHGLYSSICPRFVSFQALTLQESRLSGLSLASYQNT